MDLFQCRTRTLVEIETNFRAEAGFIEQAFSLLDSCLADLASRFNDSALSRAAGLAAAKGRMLAQGCWTLILDGLGQEAGALLRPLLEAAEFLTYLHIDGRAQKEFTDDKLPRSGEIARRIGGRLQFLRDYLNEHASHLSFSFHSLRHIVKIGDRTAFETCPQFRAESFRQNLGMLFLFMSYLLSATVTCIAKDKNVQLETEPLAVAAAQCIDRGRAALCV